MAGWREPPDPLDNAIFGSRNPGGQTSPGIWSRWATPTKTEVVRLLLQKHRGVVLGNAIGRSHDVNTRRGSSKTVLKRFDLIGILIVATVATGLVGCVQRPIKYTPNGMVLLDAMESGAADFVHDLQIGERDRVVIVDLDLSSPPGAYPSAIVYDMLAMALTERGVTVLERDTRAFYASVLEGASKRLPFQLSGPCTSRAPAAEGAPGHDSAVAGGTTPGCAPDVEPCSNAVLEPAFPEVYSHGIPEGVCDGAGPAISEQMSATQILAYRTLYYGTSIEPTEDSAYIARVSQISLMLRLIDPQFGTIIWADRVEFTEREELPAEVRSLIGEDRYEYFAPQFKGACQQETGGDGGLLGSLKKK